MPHVIEPAPTGRASCRGCGARISKGALRFGERLPNPYAELEGGEMTHWFHLRCAAYRRPEALLEALAEAVDVPEIEQLKASAQLGVTHRRLPRISTAGRASTGRAACRACKEAIAKNTWRIALVYYEDGRFVPSGFIHAGCVQSHIETTDIMDRVKHFSPDLLPADLDELRAAIA
jgi:hypothetical protein